MADEINNNRNGETKNEKAFDPAEYAERKKAERDEVYYKLDEATRDIVSSPEKFKEYLNTQARLDKYSVSNSILIYSQCPEATRLKSYKDWGDDNVKVLKGAKGISILEPSEYAREDGSTGIHYNVKKVFDISQTNSQTKYKYNRQRHTDPNMLFDSMKDTSPVKFDFVDESEQPGNNALYDKETLSIHLKEGVTDTERLCCSVARELANVQFDLNGDGEFDRHNDHSNSLVAGYMVCEKNGINADTLHVENVARRLQDKEPKDIRTELTKAKDAFSEINNSVAEDMYRKRQERSKENER